MKTEPSPSRKRVLIITACRGQGAGEAIHQALYEDGVDIEENVNPIGDFTGQQQFRTVKDLLAPETREVLWLLDEMVPTSPQDASFVRQGGQAQLCAAAIVCLIERGLTPHLTIVSYATPSKPHQPWQNILANFAKTFGEWTFQTHMRAGALGSLLHLTVPQRKEYDLSGSGPDNWKLFTACFLDARAVAMKQRCYWLVPFGQNCAA